MGPLNRQEYGEFMQNRTGNKPSMPFTACCYLETKDCD